MVGFEAKKYLKTKTKKFTTKYDKTESWDKSKPFEITSHSNKKAKKIR